MEANIINLFGKWYKTIKNDEEVYMQLQNI
jgi:hypothetical protein